MDTLEENYDISIDDYVMITFAACAKMIDAVGGVKLELSDDEHRQSTKFSSARSTRSWATTGRTISSAAAER